MSSRTVAVAEASAAKKSAPSARAALCKASTAPAPAPPAAAYIHAAPGHAESVSHLWRRQRCACLWEGVFTGMCVRA